MAPPGGSRRAISHDASRYVLPRIGWRLARSKCLLTEGDLGPGLSGVSPVSVEAVSPTLPRFSSGSASPVWRHQPPAAEKSRELGTPLWPRLAASGLVNCRAAGVLFFFFYGFFDGWQATKWCITATNRCGMWATKCTLYYYFVSCSGILFLLKTKMKLKTLLSGICFTSSFCSFFFVGFLGGY